MDIKRTLSYLFAFTGFTNKSKSLREDSVEDKTNK
jgi:hypothetical protein